MLPEDLVLIQHLERTARSVAVSSGFAEIRTPFFEETRLFTRSLGETSDVVSKEMFTVPSRAAGGEDGGNSYTFRPEGTASVARVLQLPQFAQTAAPGRLRSRLRLLIQAAVPPRHCADHLAAERQAALAHVAGVDADLARALAASARESANARQFEADTALARQLSSDGDVASPRRPRAPDAPPLAPLSPRSPTAPPLPVASPSPRPSATWYWQEEPHRLTAHNPALVKPPHWVAYPDDVQAVLEAAFQAGHPTCTGANNVVDFVARQQTNLRTGVKRAVLRDDAAFFEHADDRDAAAAFAPPSPPAVVAPPSPALPQRRPALASGIELQGAAPSGSGPVGKQR